jgi:hypothetical protein
MDRAQGLAIRDELFRRYGAVEGAIRWGDLLVGDPEIFDAVHGRELAEGVHLQNPGPDATRATEKYLRNTQAATADWAAGMQNPRRDPRAAAAAANGKFKQRVQQALNEDRWLHGVRNYDLAEAVQTAVSDGGAAYAAGIQKRSSKVARAFAELMPRLGAISQAVQQMPQDTEAAREARMLANLRAMRQLSGRRTGRATA